MYILIWKTKQGIAENPQDIMDEYNGCSVAQYTRYPLLEFIATSSERIHEAAVK